jgi:hypothetical protein
LAIYRGPGGPGDATQDASSEVLLALQAKDAALAAQVAAEAAQVAAELAETNAETAETNAETAETNAEAAQIAAEAAQAAAEAVLVDPDFQTVVAIEADITTVAGISSDVTTVAGISADVTAVAAIDSDVTTVAGIDTDVTTVAGIASDVTTVAGIDSDVTTVAGIDSDVTTVAGIASDVTAVAADATDIGLVAGSITNVNTVATDITNVNTTATNITNVNTVAGISTDVTTVAGISANVTTVAGISSDVTTVAGDSADIQLLADNIATIAAKANAGANSDITSLSGLTTPLSVAQGGTGAATLTGYVKGTGTTALTASSTIPNTDISGLGTMSTQAASNVAITGGAIDGTTVGATTASTGKFTTLEATGVTTVQAGTVSLPAITTTGDTNTGIFFPAADTIAFTEGGVEAMRIDSSGNVGIGTSSPQGIFHVQGASSQLLINYLGSNSYLDSDTIIFRNYASASYPERMRIDSSGNVGIGTTSPRGKLDVSGTLYVAGGNQIQITASAGSTGLQLIGQDSAESIIGTMGSQPLAFRTASTERMRITSSGNVGIGTSSPDVLLHVSGNTNSVIASKVENLSAGTIAQARSEYVSTGYTFIVGSSNNSSLGAGGFLYTTGAQPIAFFTNNAERMRIDSSGNVGIGSTNPSYKLFVIGNTGDLVQFTDNVNQSIRFGVTTTGIYYNNPNSGYQAWQIGGTERMRIDSSGNVGIGTSSFTALFTASGSANATKIQAIQTAAGGYNFASNAANNSGTYYHFDFTEAGTQRGSITSNGSSTTYATGSDYRLKENIEPMTGALAKVSQLKPCTYIWKSTGKQGEGFIAHELQAIVPDAVVGQKDAVNEDGSIKPQGIDTSFLVATLTAAIKELNAKVDAQAARIAALESK